jgi:Zn-dependent metalloprotease
VFLNRDEGRLRLADLRPAWLVNMQKGLDGNWMYFIDSGTGEVLKYYNHIFTDGPVTGSGLDLFNQSRTIGAYQLGSEFALIDASKPMFNAGGSAFPNDGKGVIYTLDARNSDQNLFFIVSNNVNSWTSSSGISAAANGALVYDFYQQVYGRNAIGGDGTTMNLVVNFNQNFNNAFWNGQYMVFGNGDGNAFSDLAGALDVTAHEMTHGVIERTANLIYENQPGALNESFADVFGVLFEFWVKGEAGNWLLGEDITTPGAAGDALRNMADPAAPAIAFDGQQPTKMSEFQNLPNTPDGDNGGVHVNSGIPNRAFYLFATNPAVGIEKAGEIYYQALTRYLTRSAQFIDCRLAVIRSVDDVFGAATPEAAAARAAAAQAFDAVEIFDGSGTPPPPVQPPVDGTDYVAVTDAATGLLYRFDLQSQEFLQLSTKALHSRSTTTEDGSLVLFVDESGNINMVSSDGGPEVPLTENGGFSNIAISHSGRYLAAVSSYSEPVIYLFDLEDGSGLGDRQFELYTPTTAEGVTTGNILFPDRLDWTSDDETLMYDAFNIAVNANGDTTGFWDINLLDVADGGINRLFPPQPDGISIGNAVFASNTDNIIAFDYVDEAFNVSVLGVDLNSGDAGLITNNFQSLGSPSFSGDDHRVYYQYQDQQGAAVFVVDLAEDGITGLQNDAVLINGGIMPLAFTVGTRPSPVEPTAPDEAPAAFTLLQNYPNPFNPVTTIEFALPRPSVVKLQIFDLLGREVATLLDEEKSAGTHRITWDATGFASGLYIYRLQTDGFTATRKLMVLR